MAKQSRQYRKSPTAKVSSATPSPQQPVRSKKQESSAQPAPDLPTLSEDQLLEASSIASMLVEKSALSMLRRKSISSRLALAKMS